eukprot:scaffold176382_cov17-Prasinocladus_malaysianus.AAC.1
MRAVLTASGSTQTARRYIPGHTEQRPVAKLEAVKWAAAVETDSLVTGLTAAVVEGAVAGPQVVA